MDFASDCGTCDFMGSPVTRQSSIKQRVIGGSAWTLGGFGASQVLRLGSHLVLAWLLAPEVFGLMALVRVFMQGMEMFSDVGIKPSIIQSKRGHDPAFLNTAWTIQIVRGFALWICTCLLAWPAAAMFARNDEAAWALVYLLPVAGFGTVIAGFGSTALATLSKDLRLGRLTTLEIASQIVSLSVMVVWALISPSVSAMIAGGLASGTFKMVASHLIVPGHRVRMGWDRESASELFRFGRWVFLSTAFTFVAMSMDRIILGNVLNLVDLGLYSIAYVFTMVALFVATHLGGTVLFPVYARYRDDPKRMMSIAIRSRDVVLCAGGATCVSMAIVSSAFFRILWDDRYHGAASIAQWMALYVWSMILLVTIDRIPLAMGNSRALFMSNVWRTSGVVIAAFAYLIAGLPGFIVGLAFGPILAHVYILQHIPMGRKSLLLQSTRFTGWALSYAIPAVLISRIADTYLGYVAWLTITFAMTCAPIAVCCRLVWLRARPLRHALPGVGEVSSDKTGPSTSIAPSVVADV